MNKLYEESLFLGIVATAAPVIAVAFKQYYLAVVLLILLCFLFYFYRYTPILDRFPNDTLISPASGRVTDVVVLPDDRCLISIFLSPFDNHTQVYPINGTVIHRDYDDSGKFKIVIHRDKSDKNEKLIHHILGNNGAKIIVTQIAGFLPRRISECPEAPMEVQAGEYLGMIKFGSRVDLEFPLIAKGKKINIKTSVGRKISSGDIIAEY